MIAMNEKANRSKLLAAVAAFAMVVCAFAMIMPAEDVNAEATALPDAQDGVITLTEDVTLSQNTVITDLVEIGDFTLTIAKGANVTVNYDYTANGQFIFTIGTGALVIDGGSLTVNVDNADNYKDPAANNVFTTTEDGYTSTGSVIVKSGSLTVNETVDVDGAMNYGDLAFFVEGGTVSLNGNGLVTTYFKQTGGSIDINLNDGSVTAYVVVTGGSFEVSGANTTGSTLNPDKNVFTPYAMNIGEKGEVTIDGKAGIYSGSATSAIADLTTKTVTNSGKLIVTENGELNLPEGTTVTGDVENNGTVNLNGGALNGALTGEGDVVVGEEVTMTTFPKMADETLFQYDGYEYIVYTYEYKGIYYQYGLAVGDIEYDGTAIMDSELSIIPIALPTEGQGTLTFSNTDSKWYDETNGVYEGALKADGAPSAGVYNGVIRFSATIDGKVTEATFSGNTLTKYLNLTVIPGKYTVEVTIDDWMETEYDAAEYGPFVEVTKTNGDIIPADGYTVTFEYFSDADLTKSVGTDASKLTAGPYWVKATVTPVDTNFTAEPDSTDFTVTVFVLDSDVVFHPLQDLNDDKAEEAILGFNPDEIQSNITFNAGAETGKIVSCKVTGTVNKYTLESSENAAMSSLVNKTGYFLAFYVEGVDYDIAAIDTTTITDALGITPDGTNNVAVEITPTENDTEYRYYVLYIATLAADDAQDDPTVTPEKGDDGFTYTADFDGAAGDKYGKMTYDVNVSYLNFYVINLHDDSADEENYYNDLLTYYRVNGVQFTLPSGAGEDFLYWNTEDNSTNDRVFSFGSIMVVGPQYDPNGDGIIDLYANYGNGKEPVTPEPVQPASEVLIFIGSTEGGVNIMLYGIDGSVPAGAQVVVTYSYIMNVNGINYSVPVTMTAIAVQNEDGSSAVLINVPLSAEENYLAINSVYATLTIGEGEPVNTDTISYSPVAVEA